MQEKEQENPMLKVRDWVWIVAVVATASTANMAALYRVSSGQTEALIELDEKWQARTREVTKELRSDIHSIRDGIPPDWFHEMVRQNQQDIRQLRDEIRNQGA